MQSQLSGGRGIEESGWRNAGRNLKGGRKDTVEHATMAEACISPQNFLLLKQSRVIFSIISETFSVIFERQWYGLPCISSINAKTIWKVNRLRWPWFWSDCNAENPCTVSSTLLFFMNMSGQKRQAVCPLCPLRGMEILLVWRKWREEIHFGVAQNCPSFSFSSN